MLIHDASELKGKYRLDMVEAVNVGKDGRVLSCSVGYTLPRSKDAVGQYSGGRRIVITRSVQRLSLLLPVEEQSERLEVVGFEVVKSVKGERNESQEVKRDKNVKMSCLSKNVEKSDEGKNVKKSCKDKIVCQMVKEISHAVKEDLVAEDTRFPKEYLVAEDTRFSKEDLVAEDIHALTEDLAAEERTLRENAKLRSRKLVHCANVDRDSRDLIAEDCRLSQEDLVAEERTFL